MKKAAKRKRTVPERSQDLLVTQSMLYSVRDELKADINGLAHRIDGMDARFDSIDAKFDSIDAKFNSINARFESIDAKFNAMDSKFEAKFDAMDAKWSVLFEKMLSEIHRTRCLVEEQNQRNILVLDGYRSLYDRQDRVEKRVDDFEKILLEIKKATT